MNQTWLICAKCTGFISIENNKWQRKKLFFQNATNYLDVVWFGRQNIDLSPMVKPITDSNESRSYKLVIHKAWKLMIHTVHNQILQDTVID